MIINRSLGLYSALTLGLAWSGLLLHAAPPPAIGQLSPLAPKPDWSVLQAYDRTITRAEFTHLVNTYYSPDGSFWKYLTISDDKVTVFSDLGKTNPLLTLAFAANDKVEQPRPYSYKTKAVSTDPAKPLKGLRIALDPGHIGGDWAQLEGRYFKLGNDPAVEEAQLNMITCQRHLADLLEADGADIVWAKHNYEPVTSLRPESLHREAMAALALHPDTTKRTSNQVAIERMIDNEASILFYRSAEIRARGNVVNKLHPDLTICVHYNANGWGDPDHPTLIGHSTLIIFTNGSYEKGEVVNDDQKYELLRKLLDRTAVEEARGCALVGQSMLDSFKYPPETDIVGYNAHHVTDVLSVYTRNLLANRIYHGPVIYCEGPYMNARDAYYRIIAGDYLGMRTIQGQSVPSIYRDYAGSVETGVLKYFGRGQGALIRICHPPVYRYAAPMELPVELFLALRYLRPRRSFGSIITVLSFLGVALAVLALIVVLSVMAGFQDRLTDKIVGFNAHITVGMADGGLLYDYDKVLDLVRKQPGVVAATPFIRGPVLIRFHGKDELCLHQERARRWRRSGDAAEEIRSRWAITNYGEIPFSWASSGASALEPSRVTRSRFSAPSS